MVAQIAAAATADTFPRWYGKYKLLAPLAQGGMGSLFLACQGETGMEKLCVVKTVLPALADKEYIARFRDEAKVVVQLSHGNLVPVFDAGAVGGELYIAMDFVDGKDLRTVWNRCARKGVAFPVDVAVHLVRELARGLHHAHTFGGLSLVHRDVSPPNVLIAFSGEVKLTDFGLASSTIKMEHTAPGVIYGKVSYMSPEQARGETLDGRTDQFAAAIILWELLTGRQLFPSSDNDVLDKVRACKIDAPSRRAGRVPPRLDAIVMRALARDPAARFPDCEAFRAALAEYLAREAPATDSARVANFLRDLFEDEIDEERKRRRQLVEGSRTATLGDRRKSAGVDVRATSDTPRAVEKLAPGGDGAVAATMDATPSAAIGALVGGRYRILGLAGEGGMGRVFVAEHVEIGKKVAVKLLHPAYSRSPDLVERFRREARAASRIGHPNIVDVTDSGTTDEGAVFFVMEYLDGRDLAAVLRDETKVPVARAVPIALGLANALAAAHKAGIVHRDLKPENVFLARRGNDRELVKVLDFGIAWQRDLDPVTGKSATGDPGERRNLDGRLTDPGMAMGTPEYMAPEQAVGTEADARSDIYSVGAILFEMIAGRPPYEGKNFMEVLARKSTEAAPKLSDIVPGVDGGLSDIVARALEREPARRHQSMDELARELERFRPERRATPRAIPADAPTEASQVPAPSPASSSGPTSETRLPALKRIPWLLGLVVALLVLLPVLWAVAVKRAQASATAPVPTVTAVAATQHHEPAAAPKKTDRPHHK